MLIKLVTDYQPQELSTFFKYVEQASSTALMGNFEAVANMFYLFVEQGLLKNDSKFYYASQLAIKQQVSGEKTLPAKQIVDITWAIIALEGAKVRNPLIPKALEALSQFNREAPLTKRELLQLYQISVFIGDMVARGELSDHFSKVIPKEVLAAAEDEFQKWDRTL